MFQVLLPKALEPDKPSLNLLALQGRRVSPRATASR